MQASNQDAALLALAGRLAWEAAALILGIRARGFVTSAKPDATPVTEADHRAEALIVSGLRAASDIPVVAEEEIAAGHVPPPGAPAYWFVDPLDGTRDFAAGRDGFCVNIGLVRAGRPVLGAIAIPATAELFTARAGAGAWKRDAGGSRPVRVRAAPPEGLAVLASRRMQDDARLHAILAGRKMASLSHFGSAIKLCRVAEGAADLYARFGRTMAWDTAAGHAILEEAGGRLVALDMTPFACLDTTPLAYTAPPWANPPFVASGG